MKCFDHVDQDAGGVFLCCGKGRCGKCVVDLNRALACPGPCTIEAKRLLDLRDFSFAQPSLVASRTKWATGAQFRAALFQLVLGLAFVGWYFYDTHFTYFLWMGGLLAAYGTYSAIRARPRDQ